MEKIDIQKMNKAELHSTLKDLRLYRHLKKELGARGELLFDRIKNDTHSYQVEYFDTIPEKIALDSALNVYKKVFDVSPKVEEIELLKKSSLKGGIKVYFDDKVVDMSFDKIEKTLKGQ